jgi:hypothetical protein
MTLLLYLLLKSDDALGLLDVLPVMVVVFCEFRLLWLSGACFFDLHNLPTDVYVDTGTGDSTTGTQTQIIFIPLLKTE